MGGAAPRLQLWEGNHVPSSEVVPSPPHRAGGEVPPSGLAAPAALGPPSRRGRFPDGLDSPGGAHPAPEALPGELFGYRSAKLLCR